MIGEVVLLKGDERGLTLVEVLATLVILSIIGVIIWSIFFQGYTFSQKAISKNFMLQESNIQISSLTRLHQTLNVYDIKSTNCDIIVTNNTTTPPQEHEFHHGNICFDLKIKINNVDYGSGPVTVEPTENNVSLILTASDRNSSTNNIIIDTFLYRMKGGVNY
jgi:prepilin-type N-terminal cleavage/methylation domain-containing protein